LTSGDTKFICFYKVVEDTFFSITADGLLSTRLFGVTPLGDIILLPGNYFELLFADVELNLGALEGTLWAEEIAWSA
jgi:hypothetical protein